MPAILVTFFVLNEDKLSEVKEEHPSNIPAILKHFSVFNEDKFNEVKEEHPSNILSILITFFELNDSKFNDFNPEQQWNIYCISFTFSVLNLEKLISIKLLHSQNMNAQLDNLILSINFIEYIPLFKGINDFLKGTFFPLIIKEVLLSFISLKLS